MKAGDFYLFALVATIRQSEIRNRREAQSVNPTKGIQKYDACCCAFRT